MISISVASLDDVVGVASLAASSRNMPVWVASAQSMVMNSPPSARATLWAFMCSSTPVGAAAHTMITEGFARALGAKISRVLEVGQAVNNYKRVRVNFPLDKAIMHTVQQKVRGHGEMEFMVKYENMPYFCFGYGYIGHDQRECPDESRTGGGVHFSKALRCSPQKESGKRMTIPADDSGVRRGLNFSGDQRRRALSAASSSAGPRKKEDQAYSKRRTRDEVRGTSDAPVGDHTGIAAEISEELVAGVEKMGMN